MGDQNSMTSLWTPTGVIPAHSQRITPVDTSGMTTMQYAISSLLLGANTDYNIQDIDGLDLPDTVSVDTPKSGRDGDNYVPNFSRGRTVTIGLDVGADTFAALLADLRSLKQVCQPAQNVVPFIYWHDSPRVLWVQPRRCSYKLYRDCYYGLCSGVAVELRAPDPRIYDTVLQTANMPVYSAGGGFTFPLTFNFTFGGAPATGTVNCVNNGNTTTYPVIRVTGPVNGPILQNVTSNKQLIFTLTVPTGSFVDIDFDEHSVIWNGTSVVRGAIDPTSDWWGLDPGTSQVRMTSSGVSAPGTATISWRSAWK